MKNKSTLLQCLTAAPKKTGSILLLTIFFLSSEAFSQNTWIKKADIPISRSQAVGFSIGTKGYVGTGGQEHAMSFLILDDFWEWDQATNVWTQKANFGGGMRFNAVGFSIGNKGYIGTGLDDLLNLKNDFWEWNQATNTWTKKANFPVSGGRSEAVGFSVGNKGYIGTGYDGANTTNDFWEWNKATDTWTQKANFSGAARLDAVGFSIGTKGYVGTGAKSVAGIGYKPTGQMNDFWEWDQTTDTWIQKADFGGIARYGAVGFSIGNKGYIGTGNDGGVSASAIINDFWEWDQAANVWTIKAIYPGGTGVSSPSTNIGQDVGFSIGCYGYIGTGKGTKFGYKDFWEYTPDPMPANCCVLVADISNPDTVCIGNNVFISASGGTNYSWSTGATTATITVNQSVSTTYTVIVSDANGCSDAAIVTVPVKNCCTASAVISSDPSSTVCVGQNVFISASGGTTYSWNTGAAGANIVAAPSVTTTYSVMVTDAAGCTGIGTLTVPVDPGCTATGIAPFNADALQVAVWPNPSNGEINLKVNQFENLKIESIEICNVFGEKIYPAVNFQINQSSNFQIDLSSQPDGVYFLKLKTGDATINEKIIIQK
ncbi:MAG: T9SS type A sorting domain-containing protein [Bacteroidetes bacterium]|nr:MAG: T9SS type A sorting domain-containing protein [Bacteroidota bacterium]